MMPILILAAGSSSRMRGADKLLERVGDAPLLTKQIDIAKQVSTDVRVALPPAPHPRHALVAQSSAQPVIVADAAGGMGNSLRAVFATLAPDVARAMLLLADLPDISADDIRAVMHASVDHPEMLIWRGATQDGRGGHPIVFASALFPAFARLTGDDGGRDIVRAAGDRVQLVPLEGDRARLDLDTPEAWAAWRAGRPPI